MPIIILFTRRYAVEVQEDWKTLIICGELFLQCELPDWARTDFVLKPAATSAYLVPEHAPDLSALLVQPMGCFPLFRFVSEQAPHKQLPRRS